jgi:hypothetical protein
MGIGDGAGGGSSNCSSSTGEVGRCSEQVHVGNGIASSKMDDPAVISYVKEHGWGNTHPRLDAKRRTVCEYA